MRRRLLLLGLLFAVAPASVLWFPEEPAPSGPPGLVFERQELPLGRLAEGESREATVRWRRTGAGHLGLLRLRTDCGCAVVTGLPDALPAGAEGLLTVRYLGGTIPGPFRRRVRVVTDAPLGRGLVDLWIEGHVGQPLAFRPARLDLGRRSPGRVVEREVELAVGAGAALPGRATVRVVGASGTAEMELRPGPRPAAVRFSFVVPDTPGRRQVELELDAGALGQLCLPVSFEVVAAPAGNTRPRTSGQSLGNTSSSAKANAKETKGP